MGWKILVTYDTGDSFSHTCGVKTFVEGVWKDKAVAEENAKAIEEHYRYYEAKDRTYFYSAAQKTEANKIISNAERQAWWFNNGKDGDWYTTRHTMLLKLDDGKLYQHQNSWCGYFESFTSVEVVDEDDNEGEDWGRTVRDDEDDED